jgi:hypothetical protein
MIGRAAAWADGSRRSRLSGRSNDGPWWTAARGGASVDGARPKGMAVAEGVVAGAG